MIGTLFGNSTIEKVLLFLFVNRQGFGKQIHEQLEIPLTPVQYALRRLESAGVLQSQFEGKLRIYCFALDNLYHEDLENILRKLFATLTADQKAVYFKSTNTNPQKQRPAQGWNRRDELLLFWERLLKVNKLEMSASGQLTPTKITKRGHANVSSILDVQQTLTFNESGEWIEGSHEKTRFTNRFRWKLDLKRELIHLEHLRYGQKHPVFLFHLEPSGKGKLTSVGAHLCLDDIYLGQIEWNAIEVQFYWRIVGIQKNTTLHYRYT